MPDNNRIIAPKDKSKIPPFVYGKYYLKGFEEGYKEGVFFVVKQFVLNLPNVTNEQISSIFLVDIEFVQSVRASIQAEQQ